MNKTFYVVALGLTFFVHASVVQASDPIVTLDFIEQSPVERGQNTEVEVPGFPYQLTFYGTVTHEGHGNLKRVELSATINGDLIYGPEKLPVKGNQTTAPYEIPWIVERPGTYSLAVFATHPEQEKSMQGCKAAPAIAASYLKDNDLPQGSQTKSVATVAKETGKNGELWAKESCVPDYRERTIDVVIGTVAE